MKGNDLDTKNPRGTSIQSNRKLKVTQHEDNTNPTRTHEIMSIATTTYNLRPSRHSWELGSTLNLWDPLYPVANEQLTLWNIVVWEAGVIENARLDDNCSRKRRASAEQRGTAVGAEVRCDLIAAVCSFRDLLWFAWLWLDIV